MKKKRISIRRRTGKIGFMGKGMRVPMRRRSEIVHSLSARMDEEAVALVETDLEAYREDAAITPGVLRRFMSKRPEAVVRPDSGDLVADVLDKCLEERTPATPRGAGSAGLGGAVPVRGGVIIDLTGLSEVRNIDRSRKTASVGAGCTWKKLREALEGEGLGLCSYPSGAATGTVGGWASTGGLGVGTHACGSFHEQLDAIEAAAPSGILIDAGEGRGRYSMRSFSGIEGQTGVVTRLTVRVKDLPERRCCRLLNLKRPEDGLGLIESISRMEKPPMLAKMADAGMAAVLAARWNLGNRDGPFVLVADEGPADAMAEFAGAVDREAALAHAEIENLDGNDGPWQAWFSHLDPEGGPATILAGEALVPVGGLPAFFSSLAPTAESKNLIWEATVVAGGLAMVRVMRAQPESRRKLTRDVPVTAKVVSLAVKRGGTPYGLGIWNSRYSRLVLGSYYGELRTIKRETDRFGILNPGKFFGMTTNSGIPVPGWLFSIGIRLAGGT